MEHWYLSSVFTSMFLHCPNCQAGFVNQQALQEHVKTHMKGECEDESRCATCGKVFAKRDHLKRHELTHSDIKPHKCHLCESSFKRKDKLTSHLSGAHGIAGTPPPPSSHRAMSSSGARVKEEHPRQPSPARDFVCSLCFMGFTHKYHLDRHTSASHSGVKAHQCPDCGRRFTRKDHMERHRLTHLGIKPYSCTLCDKSFTRKERLNEHFATHDS